MRLCRLVFSLILPLVSLGCLNLPSHTYRHAPLPLSEKLAQEISYQPLTCRPLLEYPCYGKHQFKHIELEVSTFNGANKVLDLEYYRPPVTEAVPVIVVLPISAGEHYSLERFLSHYIVRCGFAAVIVHRERERNPTTADAINALLRQSVLDNRQVIDWIETRPELNPRKIGVLGTSMGSIKGALLCAVEPRVRASVLALTGGDLPYIISYSTDGTLTHCGVSLKRKTYLKEHHLSLAEFKRGLEGIEWDPKLLGPYVDPKKCMLILGACDTVVPFKKGLELRAAMGYPETEVVLSGHYTSLFYMLNIRAQAFEFFAKRFNED